MRIEKGQIDKLFGEFIIGRAETIPSPVIKKKVDYYYRNYNKRLRSLPPKFLIDLRDKNAKWSIGEKVFVSRKFDGQAGFLIYNANDEGYKSYFCNATSHLTYLGHQANKEVEKIFKEQNIQSAIIAGELFMGSNNQENYLDFSIRSHIYEFIKLIKDPQGYQRLGFRAFDIIELNGEDWLKKGFYKREAKLREIFPANGRIAHVQNLLIPKTQLADYYEQIVNIGGAEGIVLRDPIEYPNYKIKPINTIDVVIIGVVSGKPGSRIGQNQLGSSLVALRYEDGTYQVVGRVGGGLTDEMRSELWEQMDFVRSSFVGVTSDGRAFQMVQPHHVATIEYLDIYTHSSDGTPKMQSCLAYNASQHEWKTIRSLPFLSLISPRFKKDQPLHPDKQPERGMEPTISDVRVDQISFLAELDKITHVTPIKLKKSKIRARLVFTNKNKVKKFVMWATNKHDQDPSYPKYVVFFADYSASRRDPLKRAVRTTNDEEQIYLLLGDWIIEELLNSSRTDLKRGWRCLKKVKYDDQYRFNITFPHGFKKLGREEFKQVKWKKTYGQLNGIMLFLNKLSQKYNLIFDSPYEAFDHALLLFKQKNFHEFFKYLDNFDENLWQRHIPEIQDETEQTKYQDIIKVFKKFSTSTFQQNLISKLT